MRIDDVSTNPLSAGPSAPAQKSSKEEFLLLLVAQLENQNPLEPQSGAEFIAQLAQFASVEQSEETNTLLAEMHAEQVAAASAGMANFVGKNAKFNTGTMHVDDSAQGVPPVDFELETGSAKARAVVLDAAGKEVRQLDLGALPPGAHSFQWDGRDELGQPVDSGDYHIEIRVEGAEDSLDAVPTSISGVVDAIDFSKGYPMMRIGGALFAPGDVLSIS